MYVLFLFLRDKLFKVFDLVIEVDILNSDDEANLLLIKRPELGVTFTKLHCWKLTQFSKCVFLDADILVSLICLSIPSKYCILIIYIIFILFFPFL